MSDKAEAYIARANIDHYLDMLKKPDLPVRNRVTIVKLLIAEEDKLGHDLEQIDFAESRAAMGRNRLNRLRDLGTVSLMAQQTACKRTGSSRISRPSNI